LGPICGSAGSSLSRRGPICEGAPAILRRALLWLPVRRGRGPTDSPGSVASRELVVLQHSGFIAGHCRDVALLRDGITSSGDIDTPRGSLHPLLGVVVAKLARSVVQGAVSALSKVAIACFLIGIGRALVAFGRALVAVGPRLVGIPERLFAISKRLIVERVGSRRDALVFWFDLPVRGIHRGRIA
jgi:hypothetical protein